MTSPLYITPTDTAKLLRKALKAAFPETRFSVRTDKYAGGSSIDVTYTDGPTKADVEKVADIYAGATFDGMTDSKNFHATLVHFDGDELPTTVQFGANFVFVHRKLSPEFVAAIDAIIQSGRSSLVTPISGALCLNCFGPADYTVNDGTNSARLSACADHITRLVANTIPAIA